MMSYVAERHILLIVVVIGLVVSGISPKDHVTWLLEALPVLIGIPILIYTRARISLTPLVYRLLAGHAIILMIGAHYTYAEVPLGRWIQDTFGFARNHYDRLGHLAQGFVPAMVIRDLLLRIWPLPSSYWLFLLVCAVCLAFSALYELFEWCTALMLGQSATAFLATQGYEWDTQWDMFMALVGSIVAQLSLSKIQYRQFMSLPLRPPQGDPS